MENHTLGRDDYEKYNKMTKIKENINKVKNILELRENLQKEMKKKKRGRNKREFGKIKSKK